MSSVFSDMVQQLRRLEKTAQALEDQRKATAKAMASLERLGLIYASTHYRDNKYFYLIYPMADGKRKREYIGCKPEKIEAAKAGIARGVEFDRLKRELEAIEGRMRNAAYYLGMAERAAS